MYLVFQMLNVVTRTLIRPFYTASSQSQVVRVVETCRIVFGLLLIHQAIDVLGFVSLLDPMASAYRWVVIRTLGAALLLTFGWFTPLASGYLIYRFGTGGYTGGSLGDMVSTIVSWGMLLFGAGRYFSIDRLIGNWFPQYEKVLFCIAAKPNSPTGLAWARFSLLTCFWTICVAAMLFHFNDRFWWTGEVLPVSLAGPYFSYHHQLFGEFSRRTPATFYYFCSLGLLVQAIWEVLLLPLMYFRIGRWFVLIQGVAFFLISLLCLNLQYLPLVEFVLWGLIFGTGWCASPVPTTELEHRNWPVRSIAFATIALALIHTVYCPSQLDHENKPLTCKRYESIQPLFRMFGMRPVCVFNREDMDVNVAWLVLSEIDEGGQPVRVVPYMDIDGGRLQYMRNDLLYFVLSLIWHRIPLIGRFQNCELDKPYPYTLQFARRIARLDARLTLQQKRRYYRVDVFSRALNEDRVPPQWLPAKHSYTWTFSLDPQDLSPTRWPVFDLPPGNWNDRQNMGKTVRWLSAQQPLILPDSLTHAQMSKK